MKPRNFPARKQARRLAAQYGGSCRNVTDPSVQDARNRRTKKNRSSAMPYSRYSA